MSHIVYRTRNKINNKFYYGVHKQDNPNEFDGYLGSGYALAGAIDKYGKDNFSRLTIKVFDDRDEAYAFEALIVDEALISQDDCYNIALGGGGGWHCYHNSPNAKYDWNKGLVLSEETKRKMSESTKGYRHTDESKQKMSEAHKGKKFSEEHRRRLSDVMTGRKREEFSKEHRRRLSYKAKRRTILECPHCGKLGAKPQMARWHFNNCKNKAK